MRTRLVAGNWKMNLTRQACEALAAAVAAGARRGGPLAAAVCPPLVYLDAVARKLAGSAVALGAQNLYHEPEGAFTGEISGGMLKDLGCRYVIVGHSERRHVLGETNAAVNRKVLAALAAGLTPIVCVGEKLDEREQGQTDDVITAQFAGSLAGLAAEQAAAVVLAYEPVWAIGTGKVASPEQAQAVHLHLRKLLAWRYNSAVADRVPLLYGGSVKAANAGELLALPDVDGLLVGGASLKAEEFLSILQAGG